jgi:transmembrane sensor
MKNNLIEAIYRFLLPKKNNHDEELIIRYYNELQKKDPEDHTYLFDERVFDRRKVFNRILGDIEKKDNNWGRNRRMFNIAASVIIMTFISILGYSYRYQMLDYANPIKIDVGTASKGEVVFIKLSDGTKVWLNADSKLQYPQKFRGHTREVTLTGEAYFDVKHIRKTPFIIHTNKVTTHVLGTSFNVSAYPEDKDISVTVVTGKVGVTVPDGNSSRIATMYVTPNQQAVYNKTKKTLTQDDNMNALSVTEWKQGRLNYHSALLSEIISDLQRKYNITIHADENLLLCSLSVNFNNEPLNKVLKVLAELINGRVDVKNRDYILQGEGCE